MKTEDAAPRKDRNHCPRFDGAVSRSRAKRRIREIFRRNKNHFPLGVSLVALPRPGISEASFSSLEMRFVEAVEKLSS